MECAVLFFFALAAVFAIKKAKQIARYGGLARGGWDAGRSANARLRRALQNAQRKGQQTLESTQSAAARRTERLAEAVRDAAPEARVEELEQILDTWGPGDESADDPVLAETPQEDPEGPPDLPEVPAAHEPDLASAPSTEPEEAGAPPIEETLEPSGTAAEDLAGAPEEPLLEPRAVCSVGPRELADSLFGAGQTGFDATRRFDQQHKGKLARWRGTLDRIEPYTRDAIFGRGPGLKLTGEVAPPPGETGRPLRWVCALPADALPPDTLERGREVEVEGVLEACDPYLLVFFLAQGRLTSEP